MPLLLTPLRHFVNQVLDDTLPPEIHGKCLRNLYRICGHRALLPTPLEIPLHYDPRENPLRRDEFADVWKGRHDGKKVAAEVLRVYPTGDLRRVTKVDPSQLAMYIKG